MKFNREKVNRWLCSFLILMTPFSWVNIAIGSVYRFVIILAFLVYLINNRFKICIQKGCISLFGIWTAYVVYTIGSMLWARSFTEAINNAMGMMLLYLMSLIFFSVAYDNQTKCILEINWIIATLFLAGMFLFGDTMQLGLSERRSLILFGTKTDANEFASFFIVGFCLIINLFLKEKQKIKKFFYISMMLLILYVVLMTASRGAILSLIIATMASLFVGLKRISIWRIMGLVAVGIVLIVLAGKMILPLIPQSNLDRLNINAIIEDSGSERSSIWSSAWKSFVTGDIWRMLIGYGYGRFGVITESGRKSMMMHNQLLQQLISYGVIGLLLYVVLIWLCFVRFKTYFREYLGVFVGIMVMSMTLTMGPSYKILWIVLFTAMLRNCTGQELVKSLEKKQER